MPRRSPRIAAVSLFLLTTALFTTASYGDELPTLDQLIEVTPNIDTSDPETKSFRFTVEINTPSLCFETDIAWKRDELIGMRTLLGKDRYPGWMISRQQTQLFDVCNGRLFKLSSRSPNFILRHTGRSLRIEHGLNEKSEDTKPIVLDLRSMIHETRERAQVSRGMDGQIQILIVPTDADSTKADPKGLIAVYNAQAPHKLHRLELFPGDNLPPILSVYNVSFNEEIDPQWPSVPTDEQLPQDVTILDRSNHDDNGILQNAEVTLVLTRAFLIPFAMEDQERRALPVFLGVDWDKTQRFATEVGPEIGRLWR